MHNDESLEILLKIASNEPITEDEAKFVRDLKIKYELVRYIYMEKTRSDMKKDSDSEEELVNFHFTPGDSFMETPIYDIVEELLKTNEMVENGDSKPLSFGHFNMKRVN